MSLSEAKGKEALSGIWQQEKAKHFTGPILTRLDVHLPQIMFDTPGLWSLWRENYYSKMPFMCWSISKARQPLGPARMSIFALYQTIFRATHNSMKLCSK